MATMRSVPLGREPGDLELKDFDALTGRPLVVVGNGPSSAMPRYDALPADAVVFRVNWFFLESHYHVGRHVDAWFSAVPHARLETMLADEVRSGRYTLDRLVTPVRVASHRDTDKGGNPFLGLGLTELDSWSVTARHPRLARHFMSRPGLPTTGLQALAFGLGVGFREIYLAGIDLYESSTARYGYTVPEAVEKSLAGKDLAPGYEDAHGLGTDLAFLRACLVEFPDAHVTNLGASETLGLYLPGPATITDRPSLATHPTPHLGEPKARAVVTLPAVPSADGDALGPVEVREPLDGRLYAEVDGRRCAYVTVVSGDYHHGARALAGSLRRVTDVPLLALCTPDADTAALLASGIHTVDVPAIVNPVVAGAAPTTARRVQDRFAATYTKLHAFRLDFLDRVVFVDSDAVVRQNVDELFDGDDFAAVPDAGLRLPTGEAFNSGVFAATPSADLFARMMAALRTTASSDGGDQGFLNAFVDAWRPLPLEYNTTKRIFSHHSAVYQDEDVKILHYVGPKPWQPAGPDGRYDELDREWLGYLTPGELQDLVASLRRAPVARAGTKGARQAAQPALRTAQRLAREGRWEAVEPTLREAWSTRPPTPGELRELGYALRRLGRNRDALHAFRRAWALAPTNASIAREVRSARVHALARPGRSTAGQVGA